MSNGPYLYKASGFFFAIGFTLAKVRQLPFVILSSALNILSLGFYLTGYSLWFVSAYFYPEQKQKTPEWYGFEEFKTHHKIAAILGLIGTIFSVTAIFFPYLIIPAVWIFVCSNSIWTIGEYHKYNNPPLHDPDYSTTYQKSYFLYAMSMTGLGAVAAATTTILFIFPAISVPVLIVSTFVFICVGAFVLEFWLDMNWGNHKPQQIKPSHQLITNSLGPGITPESGNDPQPRQRKDIFYQKKNTVHSSKSLENLDEIKSATHARIAVR